MGNVVNSDDQQNQQNNSNFVAPDQPISVGGAGGAAPISGTTGGTSSGGSGASGTTSNNNAGTGTGANMQQVSAANQNTGANDGQIGNWLTNMNSSVGGLMTSAWNGFQGSVGTAPTFSQDVFNNAINNSDPTSQGTLKSWLTGQYTGPSSWDTSSFTPQMTQYQQDIQGLGSQNGLYNWLSSNLPGETPGAAQMDTSSIWNSPNYQNDLSTWNNAYTNLNNQYTGYNNQASVTASNMTNAYKQLGTTTNDALSSYANGQMNNFNNLLSGANSQYNTLNQQLQQDQAQQGANGVSMSPYYSMTANAQPTLSNFLNPSQVTGYNNAENLLGGTPINATGGWTPGSINFDASGYNSAQTAATAAATAKAAADAAAKAKATQPTQPAVSAQQQLINSLYQTDLGRAPEDNGNSYWNNVYTTQGPSAVISGINNSPEAAIYNAYTQILGRAPDANGAGYWNQQLASGMTPAQMDAQFKASPEYQQKYG